MFPPEPSHTRSSDSNSAAPARSTLALVVCAVAALLAGSAWLATGGAQSSQESADQNQETRPRRVAEDPDNNGKPVTANTNLSANTVKTEMPETNRDKNSSTAPVPFYAALAEALEKRGMKLETTCSKWDPVERRVLEDYGAMFVIADMVVPPPVCMFKSEAEVERFQNEAGSKAAIISGARIELQPAAMEALLAAREEARQQRLDITPRGGTEAARRSFEDTLRLWDTRFLPALSYWNKRGRLSRKQVAHLRNLPLREQVREVLELEKSGIYFSKDFSKSILYSIAAPGTSQHISMLALDVSQFADERVRRILARHGWFQTVKSDLPHFTYLGFAESDLPSRGLRVVKSGAQLFWIPNVTGE
ncbi:MAG TPA: hypothetical protein VF708_21175 [Pyrinomonadaceae bacterium]|jgi:hypothetical protein